MEALWHVRFLIEPEHELLVVEQERPLLEAILSSALGNFIQNVAIFDQILECHSTDWLALGGQLGSCCHFFVEDILDKLVVPLRTGSYDRTFDDRLEILDQFPS